MTAPSGRPRRIDPALLLVLALAAAVRLAVALQPLARIDGYIVPDDAYLSLHLARSIAAGAGPWYGTGWTNGFQPLYVFLMVPVFSLVPHDPFLAVRAGMLLLIACDLATIALLWSWVRATTTSRLAPLAVASLWALHPTAIQTSVNGLETSLACLALVAVFVARQRLAARGWTALRLIGLGALLGLAGLARIDTLFAAPIVAAGLLFGPDGRQRPLARRIGAVAMVAAAALLVFAPWPLYSLHWTGSLFPVSGRAVRNIQLVEVHHHLTWEHVFRPMLVTAFLVVLRCQAVPVVALSLLALALPLLPPPRDGVSLHDRLRPYGAIALATGLLVPAYCFVVFGSWYFARYLFPLGVPVALAVGAGAEHVAQCLDGATRRRAGVALIALLAAMNLANPALRHSFTYAGGRGVGYLPIGLWARDHFAPGTRVGALQCGALGYFADRLVVINLDGVVNNAAYRAMRAGHPLAYLREQHLRFLLGWRDDARFIRDQDASFADGDIVPIERVPGFATWGERWFVFHVAPAPSPRPVPPLD